MDKLKILHQRVTSIVYANYKMSDSHIRAHPICMESQKQGRFTATLEIHHIRQLSRGRTSYIDTLMALCKSCHALISVEMGDASMTGNVIEICHNRSVRYRTQKLPCLRIV